MPALIANGVCRYTVNGVFNGRPVANIIDLLIDTTGTVLDRDEVISDAAHDILNNWTDHVLPVLHPQYVAQSVSWVDLDEADGSTGSTSSSDDNTWPLAGASGGGACQGNVAYRINKVGTARRGQRAGRMYLCGVGEDANQNANGNAVNPVVAEAVTTAMEEFRNGIDDVEGAEDRRLVVLHVVAGVYQGSSRVAALECDGTFGSQRRRLRV